MPTRASPTHAQRESTLRGDLYMFFAQSEHGYETSHGRHFEGTP
jgi:hypothetical protein